MKMDTVRRELFVRDLFGDFGDCNRNVNICPRQNKASADNEWKPLNS